MVLSEEYNKTQSTLADRVFSGEHKKANRNKKEASMLLRFRHELPEGISIWMLNFYLES